MTPEIKEDFIKAGKIAKEVRTYAISLVKPGVLLSEVADKVEKKIEELGGKPAFPMQISRNNIAAHYCPTYEEEVFFKENDLIKVDIGVHINGYIADTAQSIDLGGNEKLLRASEEALNNAIKLVKPGVQVREIGKTIQETIESHGFKPVRNLCGHGIGRFIVHKSPSIPNFDNGDTTVLEEGMTIAIEPFASSGAGLIKEEGKATIFALISKKPVRGLFTRKVLNEILKFDNLPFAYRWLEKKFKKAELAFAFRELKQLGVLREHPPLPDVNNGLVSQREHTMLVLDKTIVTTK